MTRLNLCETAIDEQFRSRDITALVGREKHHGLRDLVGGAESTQRNSAADHLSALLACFRGSQHVGQAWRVDGARAYRVHANAALLQIRRPSPRKGAHGGFGRAVNAVRRQPFAADDGCIEDDGSAIRQLGRCFLHCEQKTFDIYVEGRIVEFLGYAGTRS